MTLEEVRALGLQPGQKYRFNLSPFVTPTDETIIRSHEDRAYDTIVQMRTYGPGSELMPFVRVARDDGTKHLIAVEIIDSVEGRNALA
ncbi:hypothetical protein ACMHYO_12050 [Allopusillimonas ginsengisoli]|uniref:hypothetical protein n=1 Tax=Allopusillimonas ginsengisoli TaxID=453575 RepID=UPI0039C3E947